MKDLKKEADKFLNTLGYTVFSINKSNAIRALETFIIHLVDKGVLVEPKQISEEDIFNLSKKWAQHDPDDPTDNDPNLLEQIRRSYVKGFEDCMFLNAKFKLKDV